MEILVAAVYAEHPITPLRVLKQRLFERGFEEFTRDTSSHELTFRAKIFVFKVTEGIGHYRSPL